MFKLRQIINKHNNAPEMERVELDYSTNGFTENIYFYHENTLYGTTEYETDTLYIIGKTLSEYEVDSRTVECFRITPEMIIEANCSENCTTGSKFKFTENIPYSGIESITPLPDGSEEKSYGYIIDSSDYKSKGTVLVRFHCKQ